MRFTRRAFRLGPVLALAAGGAALAVDVPVAGRLLVVRDGEVAKVVARAGETPFTVPVAGGPGDPTANVSSVVIRDLGGGGVLGAVDLPGGRWKGLGKPAGRRGWVYENRAAAGGDPVRRVVLKPRIIKVVAGDDGSLDGPVAGEVWMRLTVGGDAYCARFGGTTVRNQAGLVKRKEAAAPEDCTAPPACGDGVVQAPAEECDDGGRTPGDGCDGDCRLESVNPALCAGVPSAPGTALALSLVADGLESPVHVTAPRLDPNRLFVVEQRGRVRVVRDGVLLPTPYLSIEGLVRYSGEQGLLSVAFHPDFETNGYFFVYYVDVAGDVVIARYAASGDPSASDDADEASAALVTKVPHPVNDNHNGGTAAFGPDGLLWAATGDGGGTCDAGNNARNDAVALGKLLRLDVGGALPIDPVSAVWHKGLRNPFRFSFDRGTGDLYIGDVGQNAWEEIDHDPFPVSSGVDWGWDAYEGTHCASEDPVTGGSGCPDACPGPAGITMPVVEYNHGVGQSVTGGFVYRGCALPDLVGTYFYSDFHAEFVRTFDGVVGGVPQNPTDRTADVDPSSVLNGVSSFGEDARGELYVVSHGYFVPGAGAVYRIVPE
jgi:cysteine-rich repeat protein